MSRKKAREQAKPPAGQRPDPGAASVLPMDLQVGDRFTDHGFEWEVLTRPAHMHGGKMLRVRIRRPGIPETERDMSWPAHERVEVRRTPRAEP